MVEVNSIIPNVGKHFRFNNTNIVINKEYESSIKNIIKIILEKNEIISNYNLNKTDDLFLNTNPVFRINVLNDFEYVNISIYLFKLNDKIVIDFNRNDGEYELFYEIINYIALELLTSNITNLERLVYNKGDIAFENFQIYHGFKPISSHKIDEEEYLFYLNEEIKGLGSFLDSENSKYLDVTCNHIKSLIHILINVNNKKISLNEENKNIINKFIYKGINSFLKSKKDSFVFIDLLRYTIILLLKFKIQDNYMYDKILDNFKLEFNELIIDQQIETCTKKNLIKL
jgi:hypothetical protein